MTTHSDEIIETRLCKKSGKEFQITQQDAKFYEKISPTFGEYKAEIPFPTLCPEERKRRRLAFRNERKLYRRICDATKQPIISIYSPDKPYRVFDQKIWWGDSRDALEYGRDFDFTRTFTEQFNELMLDVPRIGIMNDDGVGSENCGYCQDFAFGKNCYMCTGSWRLEDSMYSHFETCESSFMVDCLSISGSQYCYSCVFSKDLYKCAYLERSQGCSDCTIGFNLLGCKDCIACYDMKNAQYCILNKQYTKKEYEELKEKLFNDINSVRERFLNEIEQKNIRTHGYMIQSEGCEGEYLFNCLNVLSAYGSHNCKNSSFLFGGDDIKNCYDIIISGSPERCYEGVTPDNCYEVLFSTFTWKSKYCYYTDICQSSEYLFGCVGLKNQSYCIFNKQYTKEEYNILVPKIIEHMKKTGEWGEFFDPLLSPFGYNETVAQEWFSLSENDNEGFLRSTYISPASQSPKIVESKDIPLSIKDVQDDILTHAIKCEVTGKLFRLQPQELVFYKKLGIPVPRKHPDQRYVERITLRK